MIDNNEPLPPADRSGYPVTMTKSGESAPSGHPAGQSTGHFSRSEIARRPLPEAVLSCGGAVVALWLYARGYDPYAVKTELRAYGFSDARYCADIMGDGPEGARQHAEARAGRAGDAIAPDGPYADDPAAWHAVFSEEARSIVRTILRHRRAGNRDAAKAVRCLLPSRDDWREWTGTQTVRQIRHYARAARDNEALAYAAYLYAVDRPGVLASDPVARILYEAGVGM